MSKTIKLILSLVAGITVLGIITVGFFWNWYSNELMRVAKTEVAFNEPMRIAKAEVAILEKSTIPILKDLEVTKFLDLSNISCRTLKYNRGYFADDACLEFFVKRGLFDTQAELDLLRMENSFSNVPIEQISLTDYGAYIFIRKLNSPNDPQTYIYKPNYNLSEEKNRPGTPMTYTPIDQNWLAASYHGVA